MSSATHPIVLTTYVATHIYLMQQANGGGGHWWFRNASKDAKRPLPLQGALEWGRQMARLLTEDNAMPTGVVAHTYIRLHQDGEEASGNAGSAEGGAKGEGAIGAAAGGRTMGPDSGSEVVGLADRGEEKAAARRISMS